MGQETLKRFDRIVAILIQLQSKRIVKAQELADRFEVSLRTIYRDIRTLETSGVPIASEAGIGYSIMEGYRLPPIMFTREEAGSFVAAEKLMQQFTDKSLGAYHQSAMYKVKSILRGKEKDWITALESQVRIDPAQALFNEAIPDALEILFESIAEKKQVALKYHSLESEIPSERIIEPVGLFHENNFWYVLGYCQLRKDYRQFRTDRILKIQRTLTDFTLEHGGIDDYRNQSEEQQKTKIRILVDTPIARFMRGTRSQYGYVSEEVKKEGVEMTFMTSFVQEGFSRWYLMFADYATILEPESLKERIRELLKRSEARL
ncbi:MAG TPA: YafY family transcriptional regulator [Pricia antarctica]|uniref:YafY family transcriptional regulator n=3 Tax=root TaxID=1 RepID=A0A831QTE5_9FLAO|nr:YafY family transcriptional regulator [Pricia antarctica]